MWLPKNLLEHREAMRGNLKNCQQSNEKGRAKERPQIRVRQKHKPSTQNCIEY